MSAIARGIELDQLETTVRIAWDPFVSLHLEAIEADDGPVGMFGGLVVEIKVAGPALDETDRAYLEESVGRPAVYNPSPWPTVVNRMFPSRRGSHQ